MPTLREQYYARLKEETAERFKNHKVHPQMGGSFLVRSEYTNAEGKNTIDSNGWMEVHVLRNGLYSGGDYDFVVFGHYSGLDPIAWMGNKPMGDDYAFEKARIGMGSLSECLYEVDPKIFTEEAVAYVRECIQDEEDGLATCDPADRSEYRREIRRYKEVLQAHLDDPHRCWTREWLHNEFTERSLEIDAETLRGFGRIRNSRFYMAHEAIRKVYAALNPPG